MLAAIPGVLHRILVPALPQPPSEVPDGTQRLVPLGRAGGAFLPRLAVAPWWHDQVGLAGGRGLVDAEGVVGPVAADHPDPLGLRQLRQQARDDLANPVPVVRHLHGPHFMAVRVDHQVHLTPDPPLVGPVFPNLPLALAEYLQPRAVNHEVQQPASRA